MLDANSTIGQVYLAGSNDGHVKADEEVHPVLDCIEVVTTEPYYLFAKRDLSSQGKSHQTLHIPHAAVLFIQHYEDEGPRPIGFHASNADDS